MIQNGIDDIEDPEPGTQKWSHISQSIENWYCKFGKEDIFKNDTSCRNNSSNPSQPSLNPQRLIDVSTNLSYPEQQSDPRTVSSKNIKEVYILSYGCVQATVAYTDQQAHRQWLESE